MIASLTYMTTGTSRRPQTDSRARTCDRLNGDEGGTKHESSKCSESISAIKPAKRQDEDRYSRSFASQTLPVYGRSSKQTASVFYFGAPLVGFTGAYPYDGREAVHSTALTKSAADFNCSRRPSAFLSG